MYLSLFHQFD